jgi:hypothetical protein
MSKYNPLWEYIASNKITNNVLTFSEIKSILGFDIDHSFLNSKKELQTFGYEIVKISLKEKKIVFNKCTNKK